MSRESSQNLINDVNEKLTLLLEDNKQFKRIMFGPDGKGGICEDVRDVKKELIGDPAYNKKGLISIVTQHDEFYKKMKHMGTFALILVSFGGAVGTGMMWIAHRFDKIKELFN